MNKMTHREVVLLLVLFVLLGGFLYYQFYFLSFQTKYEKLGEDISTIEVDLAARKQAQAILESQRAELDKLRQSTQQELAKVMPAYDQIEVVDMIQGVFQPLVERYDITFNTDVAQQDYTNTYTVTVDTYTSYTDFRLLLNDLRDSQYVNRVVVADLQNNEDQSTQADTAKFSCEIQVEFLTLMESLQDKDYPLQSAGDVGNANLMGE